MAEPIKVEWPAVTSLRAYLMEHGWEEEKATEIAGFYVLKGRYSIWEYNADDPDDENDEAGNKIMRALDEWNEQCRVRGYY